jgi:hypothetical protein
MINLYFNWQSFLAKMLAISERQNATPNCLGFLGQRDANRIISICIISPKVTKTIKASFLLEQRTLKNVSNGLNTNIYSYLETSGGQSHNLYLNVVHFFNTSLN